MFTVSKPITLFLRMPLIFLTAKFGVSGQCFAMIQNKTGKRNFNIFFPFWEYAI